MYKYNKLLPILELYKLSIEGIFCSSFSFYIVLPQLSSLYIKGRSIISTFYTLYHRLAFTSKFAASSTVSK